MSDLAKNLIKAKANLDKRGLGELKDTLDRLLSYDLAQLEAKGLNRDHENYRFVVSYPYSPLMNPLKSSEVIEGYSPQEPIALYVHLPFCLSICTFCGRFIKAENVSSKKVESYVNALIQEMELVKSLAGGQLVFDSVYFGGGTPTILSDEEMKGLLTYFLQDIELNKNAEITWETTPETAIPEKVNILLDAGVNRISMGVQDFDKQILAECNRLHNGRRAEQAIQDAQDMGVKNLNIDLIHGLPNQNLEHREKTINTLLEYKPSSITDYPLYTRPESSISELPTEQFPPPGERLVMQARAAERFIQGGYRQRPIHWFTQPGVSHIQQEKKFRNQELLGLGISSYSYLNGYQVHNISGIDEYLLSIKKKQHPIDKGIKLSEDQEKARYMIFGMKMGDVKKKEYKQKFDSKIEEEYQNQLDDLCELDLLMENTTQVKLSSFGQLFSEEVALEFIDSKTKALITQKGISKYGEY